MALWYTVESTEFTHAKKVCTGNSKLFNILAFIVVLILPFFVAWLDLTGSHCLYGYQQQHLVILPFLMELLHCTKDKLELGYPERDKYKIKQLKTKKTQF